MATTFQDSVTKENLMRSFAGESMARNRYLFAASEAKKQDLQVIEQVFLFTADQEMQHAEVFYKHLQELSGSTIHMDGSYPVDIHTSVLELLRAAQHNEYEEYNDVYQAFGEQAKEEGFMEVSNSFRMIADIEKIHGNRFKKLADLMEQDRLFVADVETGWMCLNCGYIHHGAKLPPICPVCSHAKGFFIRLDLAPYTCKCMFGNEGA